MKYPVHVDSLRLTGGVFAVYQQLEEKVDFSQIKSVLYTSFVIDGFLAYEKFTE